MSIVPFDGMPAVRRGPTLHGITVSFDGLPAARRGIALPRASRLWYPWFPTMS